MLAYKNFEIVSIFLDYLPPPVFWYDANAVLPPHPS